MAELGDLYQQVIIDHAKHPRNLRAIADPTRSAVGDNPLCGDRITVYLRLEGNLIADVSFEGSGCAISRASGSLMTSAVRGKSTAEAEDLFRAFHAMLTGTAGTAATPAPLGKLAAFAGVRQFPARVKCANLSWHALHAALTLSAESVSTE
ncbi:MAG: SUF system NifU family Fe-S cluster assembly protein [Gemmatimonadetes bacterium]|nr:SUF system NifU family Fe-S cluster assembly protein [Gemmatimonadota bacterium]